MAKPAALAHLWHSNVDHCFRGAIVLVDGLYCDSMFSGGKRNGSTELIIPLLEALHAVDPEFYPLDAGG